MRSTKLLIIAFCFGWPCLCLAAGFRTPLGSIEQLGLGGGGEAAQADDPTTAFSNIAGITRIKKLSVATSNSVVLQYGTFTGSVTGPFTTATGVAKTESTPVDARSFFLVAPLPHDFAFGLSITSPFGLGIQFPGNSIVKNVVTSQKLETVNLGPGLAYRFKHLSIGAGIDPQYAQSVSRSVVPLPPVPFVVIMKNNSMGWAWGWHAGLLYEFTQWTRVGLSYRSAIRHQFSGVSNALPFFPANNNFNFNLPFPASTALSLYHAFTSHWAAMGTVEYTQWSIDQQLDISNTAQGTPPPVYLNFKDTFRFGFGIQYDPTSHWALRTGISTERTPTNNADRNLVIQPDSNTLNISFGLHHQMLDKLGLDLAYSHVFFQPASINNTFGNELVKELMTTVLM